MPISGGCHCGAVRYESESSPRVSTVCHCENCRRATGAQAVAFAIVPSSGFRYTRGVPTTFHTDTNAIREFCAACGTTLTYIGDDRKHEVDIHTATLDDAEAFPPTKDTFADEKLSWVHLVTAG